MEPSSTDRSLVPLNVTTGAESAIVTVFDRVTPADPGASVGVASTTTMSPLLGLMEPGFAPVQLVAG